MKGAKKLSGLTINELHTFRTDPRRHTAPGWAYWHSSWSPDGLVPVEEWQENSGVHMNNKYSRVFFKRVEQ